MSGARPFRMVARMPDDVPRDMRHLCKQFPGMRSFIPSNPGEGGRCSLYAASERPRPCRDQRRFILRTNEPGTPEVHGAGRFGGGGRAAPGPRAGRNSGRRRNPARVAVRQRGRSRDDRDTSRGADAHLGQRTAWSRRRRPPHTWGIKGPRRDDRDRQASRHAHWPEDPAEAGVRDRPGTTGQVPKPPSGLHIGARGGLRVGPGSEWAGKNQCQLTTLPANHTAH
jgi:hypothetical protein